MERIAHITICCFAAWLTLAALAVASEQRGQVVVNGFPEPGATVTATHGDQKLTTVTDALGQYVFPDLADGAWTLQVELLCFAPLKQDVIVAPKAPPATWDLKLLSLDQIRDQTKPLQVAAATPQGPETHAIQKSDAKPGGTKPPEMPKPAEQTDERASDGLLINGSVNNAAVSPSSLAQAFGNTRSGWKGLYNGGLAVLINNSALDARPFSLSGLNKPKSAYNEITGVATFGGPFKIPHLVQHGPNFFVGYQWVRNRSDSIDSALVPDAAKRGGDFSGVQNPNGSPVEIFNPATGKPFAGNIAPLSQQAQELLNFDPLPNVAGNSRYNYQAPIVSNSHQDALQSCADKEIGLKDQLSGGFGFESTRSSSANLFGFVDTTDVLGLDTHIHWSHRLAHSLFLNTEYKFSRLRTQVRPYFENREDVSKVDGISGNDDSPTNWGPPSLNFASGFAPLSDAVSAYNRNETNSASYLMNWNHALRDLTFGGDFRRQEFNYFSQQNPRGSFTFTGAATQNVVNGVAFCGNDFADFLLGIPDTIAIAYGNADKYFCASISDAYVTEDWRVRPELSVNAGMRWEYGSPITEPVSIEYTASSSPTRGTRSDGRISMREETSDEWLAAYNCNARSTKGIPILASIIRPAIPGMQID